MSNETTARQCIFCSNPADSYEHIFANWINKIFDPKAIGPIGCEVVQYSPDGTIVRAYQASQVAGHRHRIVCSDCNGDKRGGWMSDLEGDISPLLTPVIKGQPRIFDPVAQLLIATWAIKTAMVAETIMQFPASFSRADCELVHTQGHPPLRAHVSIAAYQGTLGIATRYLRSIGGIKRGDTPVMDLYVHTIQVGALVLQVRGTTTLPATDNRSLQELAVPGYVEIPLFPPRRALHMASGAGAR
ncbi:MAG: hypothetical protein ABR972_13925 [Acidimicrobiales bacterium]|jgi:hypothetical protein